MRNSQRTGQEKTTRNRAPATYTRAIETQGLNLPRSTTISGGGAVIDKIPTSSYQKVQLRIGVVKGIRERARENISLVTNYDNLYILLI